MASPEVSSPRPTPPSPGAKAADGGTPPTGRACALRTGGRDRHPMPGRERAWGVRTPLDPCPEDSESARCGCYPPSSLARRKHLADTGRKQWSDQLQRIDASPKLQLVQRAPADAVGTAKRLRQSAEGPPSDLPEHRPPRDVPGRTTNEVRHLHRVGGHPQHAASND